MFQVGFKIPILENCRQPDTILFPLIRTDSFYNMVIFSIWNVWPKINYFNTFWGVK